MSSCLSWVPWHSVGQCHAQRLFKPIPDSISPLRAPPPLNGLGPQGVAEGIRHGDEVAKAKFLIGDPSYFPKDKIKATGRCEEGD